MDQHSCRVWEKHLQLFWQSGALRSPRSPPLPYYSRTQKTAPENGPASPRLLSDSVLTCADAHAAFSFFLSFFVLHWRNCKRVRMLGVEESGREEPRPYSYLSFVLNDAMSYMDIFVVLKRTNIPEHKDQNIHLVCLDPSTALKKNTKKSFCTVYFCFCFFLKKS